jgi:hypothetical protein
MYGNREYVEIIEPVKVQAKRFVASRGLEGTGWV